MLGKRPLDEDIRLSPQPWEALQQAEQGGTLRDAQRRNVDGRDTFRLQQSHCFLFKLLEFQKTYCLALEKRDLAKLVQLSLGLGRNWCGMSELEGIEAGFKRC